MGNANSNRKYPKWCRHEIEMAKELCSTARKEAAIFAQQVAMPLQCFR